MANTYTQLYVHIIFAVKRRANLIPRNRKDELYKYISGVIGNKDQKLMIINGVSDHLHLLVGLKPDCRLSDLVRDIKANSSRWINEQNWHDHKFEWQTGFGAFSVSQSGVKAVINYIAEQEEHHKRTTFRQEYIEYLESYEIEFRSEYLFEDFGCAFTPLNEDDGAD